MENNINYHEKNSEISEYVIDIIEKLKDQLFFQYQIDYSIDNINKDKEYAKKVLLDILFLLIRKIEKLDLQENIRNYISVNWIKITDEKFLIESIENCNYEMFKMLLLWKINFLWVDLSDHLSTTISSTIKFKNPKASEEIIEKKINQALEDRVKMLNDLVKIWYNIEKKDIIKFIESENINLINLSFENDQLKDKNEQIFNTNLIKELLHKTDDKEYSDARFIISINPELKYYITSLFYKLETESKL